MTSLSWLIASKLFEGRQLVSELDPGLLVRDKDVRLRYGHRWVIKGGGGKPSVRTPILTIDLTLCGIGQRGPAITTEASANPGGLLDRFDGATGDFEVPRSHLCPSRERTAKRQLARP